MAVTGDVLLVLGALLAALAALGVLRLPDVLSRMHAQSKATTLALVLLALGAGLRISDDSAWARLALLVALQLLTAPVAAHLVGRAAHARAPRLRVDELGATPADEADGAQPG